MGTELSLVERILAGSMVVIFFGIIFGTAIGLAVVIVAEIRKNIREGKYHCKVCGCLLIAEKEYKRTQICNVCIDGIGREVTRS